MKMKYLFIGCGVLLLLAIPAIWPYDFYVLLRWVISISSAYIAYRFYKSNIQSWMFVFAGLMFLFNPVFPINLIKSSWVFVDLVSSILFFVSSNQLKNNGKA